MKVAGMLASLIGAGVLWQAAAHPRFASEAPGASKDMCGVKGDQKAIIRNFVQRGEIEELLLDENAELPDSNDSEENWPQCLKIIDDIRDQSNCGCCWAFAGAQAASDRMCMSTNASIMVPLPAQDVCFNGGGMMSMGCDGGQISSPWSYMKRTGAVTGGQYQGSGPLGKGLCSDFLMPHCHHYGPRSRGDDPYPAESEPGCPSQSSPPGPKKCDADAKAPHNDFKVDKYSFSGNTVTAHGEKGLFCLRNVTLQSIFAVLVVTVLTLKIRQHVIVKILSGTWTIDMCEKLKFRNIGDCHKIAVQSTHGEKLSMEFQEGAVALTAVVNENDVPLTLIAEPRCSCEAAGDAPAPTAVPSDAPTAAPSDSSKSWWFSWPCPLQAQTIVPSDETSQSEQSGSGVQGTLTICAESIRQSSVVAEIEEGVSTKAKSTVDHVVNASEGWFDTFLRRGVNAFEQAIERIETAAASSVGQATERIETAAASYVEQATDRIASHIETAASCVEQAVEHTVSHIETAASDWKPETNQTTKSTTASSGLDRVHGFAIGTPVVTHSLATETMNGSRGIVLSAQGDRVVVSFPPPIGSKSLKPSNLKAVDT